MRTFLLLMTLTPGPLGLAPSGLVASAPAAGSTVRERLATVRLTFNEAVDPRSPPSS